MELLVTRRGFPFRLYNDRVLGTFVSLVRRLSRTRLASGAVAARSNTEELKKAILKRRLILKKTFRSTSVSRGYRGLAGNIVYGLTSQFLRKKHTAWDGRPPRLATRSSPSLPGVVSPARPRCGYRVGPREVVLDKSIGPRILGAFVLLSSSSAISIQSHSHVRAGARNKNTKSVQLYRAFPGQA